MARFFGTMRGRASEQSVLGTPQSGLRVKANGWYAGIVVVARTEGDKDFFEVYVTEGSNGLRSRYKRIFTVTANTNRPGRLFTLEDNDWTHSFLPIVGRNGQLELPL